jgi:GntR family transcriptional regulator
VDLDSPWKLGALPQRRVSLPSEIASALIERIRSGELPPGTRLPSEPQLAQSLGVSRNSVREAISVLREQGLIETRQGIGTFTLDPTRDANFPVDVGIEGLTSTTEMIRRAGHKPGTHGYTLQTGVGDPNVRKQLGLAPDEQIHALERVRTADDIPVIVCRDYLGAGLVPPRVMAQYRGDESLLLFLHRECRLDVQTARADIVPAIPTTRVAELLDVPRRRPLLILKQLHFDAAGSPFLYSENFFNLAYMGLHVRRTPVL